MHIITAAYKMDMSYDFYIKPNMCALEWKLNAMNNKNKSLINNFDRIWKNPLNGKFESYRVRTLKTYCFSIHVNGSNGRCAMIFKRI